MRVRIATPAYRGLVTQRHAAGLLQLQQDLAVVESPHVLQAYDGANEHLVTARNVIFSNAMAMESADVLLWLDADVALVYSDPKRLYEFIQAAVSGDVAMVGAACARRAGLAGVGSGQRNVLPLTEEERPRVWWTPYEVRAVGLGACAYNLRWFRRNVERPLIDELHFFAFHGGVTEDHRACAWVREKGGRILVDPCMGTWHDGMVVEGVERRVVMS